jgi:5-methyltetrahydrofolate--homocysteine methyltransferase
MSIGAGNVGFALPDRPPLTATFLVLAMAHGLTAAITNPIETEIRKALLAADLMLGHDPMGRRWVAHYRKAAARPAATGPAA